MVSWRTYDYGDIYDQYVHVSMVSWKTCDYGEIYDQYAYICTYMYIYMYVWLFCLYESPNTPPCRE